MNAVIWGRVPSFCSSEKFPGDSDVADSGTTLLSTKVWKVTIGSSGVDFFWKTEEGPAREHFSCIWKEGVHWASLEASQRRGCNLEILGVAKRRIWGNRGGRIRTVRKKGEPECRASKGSYGIPRVKEEVSGIPTGNSFVTASSLAAFALFALISPALSWLS